MSLTIVDKLLWRAQLLDDGRQGFSTAATSSTPDAPRGVSLRAVRQDVANLKLYYK